MRGIWGQGFSEPEAGSDLAGVRTRAVSDGDEWVIDGQKIWTTFGSRADWLYVLCRTDPDAPQAPGAVLLLVPADQPGVDIRPIRNLAGGDEFAEVFFTDARTAADLVVGPVDGGWNVVMGTVGTERGTTVLPYQAAFEQQLHELSSTRARRARSDDPVVRTGWSTHGSVCRSTDTTTRGCCTACAHRRTRDRRRRCRSCSGRMAPVARCSSMMDVLGADAHRRRRRLRRSTRSRRVFLNSRAETIYGGANEIQRNIVAERVLGLPKEPRRMTSVRVGIRPPHACFEGDRARLHAFVDRGGARRTRPPLRR